VLLLIIFAAYLANMNLNGCIGIKDNTLHEF